MASRSAASAPWLDRGPQRPFIYCAPQEPDGGPHDCCGCEFIPGCSGGGFALAYSAKITQPSRNFPSIPSIPWLASWTEEYLTKPNPLEKPVTRSVTTRACITSPNFAANSLSLSVVVRLLSPEMKRLGEGSAFGGGVGAFGGAKADTENMRRNPDLATAAAIAGIF